MKRYTRLLENFGIGHDSDELVDARPRNRPRSLRLGQIVQSLARRLEPSRILPMGIDQNVRVNRGH